MLDGNRFPKLALLLPQFADASISDAVSPAHHLADHLARQIFVAVGAQSWAGDALRRRVLIFDAVLAVGTLNELARTFIEQQKQKKLILITIH